VITRGVERADQVSILINIRKNHRPARCQGCTRTPKGGVWGGWAGGARRGRLGEEDQVHEDAEGDGEGKDAAEETAVLVRVIGLGLGLGLGWGQV